MDFDNANRVGGIDSGCDDCRRGDDSGKGCCGEVVGKTSCLTGVLVVY